MAKDKAKKSGVSTKPAPKPSAQGGSASGGKAKTPAPRVPAVLLWILGILVVLLLVFGVLLRFLINSQGAETASVRPTATPVLPGIAAEAELPQPTAGALIGYQLRVETQQLVNPARGTWAPIAAIGIYLTPFENGDAGPDFSRPGTLRQETALETTTGGVLVAQTTFTAPTNLYWVAVDEAALPSGCAVWVPGLRSDPENGIALSRWKIVGITRQGDFNTMVVKFQIVCGLAVSSTATPVTPQVTPTEPPRETPTTPPSTSTPEPTEVGCNCETPISPLPTIAPPTEWAPTPPATPIW